MEGEGIDMLGGRALCLCMSSQIEELVDPLSRTFFRSFGFRRGPVYLHTNCSSYRCVREDLTKKTKKKLKKKICLYLLRID